MKYFIVLLASVLFGIIPSIQTNVLRAGVTPLALVVTDNGIACGVSVLYCLIRKIPIGISRRQLAESALIGGFGLGITDIFLDYSYLFIPVGMASMLHFLFPAIVTVMMVSFYGEKMNRWKAGAVFLSIAGMLFLTGGGLSNHFKGMFFALITALSYAFYMIATEKGEISRMQPVLRTLYTNFFAALLAVLLLPVGKNVFPYQAWQWGQCIIIGLMLFMGILLLNVGIREMGAGSAALLNMFEPVTSLAVSTAVYHDPLSGTSLFGCALICGALILTALNDMKIQNAKIQDAKI